MSHDESKNVGVIVIYDVKLKQFVEVIDDFTNPIDHACIN